MLSSKFYLTQSFYICICAKPCEPLVEPALFIRASYLVMSVSMLFIKTIFRLQGHCLLSRCVYLTITKKTYIWVLSRATMILSDIGVQGCKQCLPFEFESKPMSLLWSVYKGLPKQRSVSHNPRMCYLRSSRAYYASLFVLIIVRMFQSLDL